ncbi:Carbon starvation protein A [Posidoniimonas polymericola]|uniref:Carbon starvation protein A n=1 Tax=Posidoniimonas polymericola TaxID=2528002 RepID=A0A5C5YGM0_9BACT|nr:carbon starvation protein A [Posidoniimonas polymericola]TWT74540.1 Carbon starvation protein A [Posidoniimonas polymericola]
MFTLAVALGSFFAFIVAYHTYGRWIGQRIFQLSAEAVAPSHALRDDVDFVPTKPSVIFGHHFTSIAGTGPIVGPAIAVFWGWLPALLWVVLGSIFVGAVHDFGSLVLSLRNQGQTIGEVAGRVISPRAKLLFLLVLFFALMVVLAIFGLVIAIIFKLYPASVLSVWTAMPLAVVVGLLVYRAGVGLLWPSVIALVVLYATVAVGAYAPELGLDFSLAPIDALGAYGNPVVVWTMLLLAYCYVASVLPVWLLLQPRDYINSHQLMVALALLVGGLAVAGLTGKASLSAAPMIATEIPEDAPPIFPFLFITIACGACSGFHCLVASGTTSKQIDREPDARLVGYGGMLLEGALAVVVILACCAGLGMGVTTPDGKTLTGAAAWQSKYDARITTSTNEQGQTVTSGGWKNHKLPQMVGGFVEGGANFVSALGVPKRLSVAIIAVLVACFAATTLDTATRLQRYVIQELGGTLGVAPLTNKHIATGIAVVTGGAVALIDGGSGPGSGGLILWPLFGATNQLLAGLALMVIVFYLLRRGLPVWFAALPMVLMLVVPGWAMAQNIAQDFWPNGKHVLLGFGVVILLLQVWMVIEAAIVLPRAWKVLERQPAHDTPVAERA